MKAAFSFLVGGITTLTLSDTIYKSKPVFHARAIGQTSGIANTIYGVKDIYESWFDKSTTLPYNQIRNIKEGRYTIYNQRQSTTGETTPFIQNFPVNIRFLKRFWICVLPFITLEESISLK